jgi:O-antigen ligase
METELQESVAVDRSRKGSTLLGPQAGAFAALFLLYSNLLGIAVSHHGVPRALAGALPLLLLAWPAGVEILRTRRLVLQPAFFLVALFLAVQAISAGFSRDPEVSIRAVRDSLLEGTLLYLFVTNAVRTPSAVRGASWALLLAAAPMALVPLHQQATGSFHNDYGGLAQVEGTGFRTGEVQRGSEVVQRRLGGPIGEKNRYAQVMLMLLPLGLFRFWGERSRALRLAALAATAFSLIGFGLAFSRGGAVGLVLLLAAMVVLRIVDFRRFALVVAVVALLFVAMPQYWSRIATSGSAAGFLTGEAGKTAEMDGAMAGRVTEMLAAGYVFADHPVIGVGPGMFRKYSQRYGNRLGIRRLEEGRRAHSLYLELAAETGALGLFAFLGGVGVTLLGLDRVRRGFAGEDPEISRTATAWFLVLVVYLGTGLFLHLAYERYFYLALALGGATLQAAADSRRERAQPVPAGAAEVPA